MKTLIENIIVNITRESFVRVLFFVVAINGLTLIIMNELTLYFELIPISYESTIPIYLPRDYVNVELDLPFDGKFNMDPLAVISNVLKYRAGTCTVFAPSSIFIERQQLGVCTHTPKVGPRHNLAATIMY